MSEAADPAEVEHDKVGYIISYFSTTFLHYYLFVVVPILYI
jgi:hypothetical protein